MKERSYQWWFSWFIYPNQSIYPTIGSHSRRNQRSTRSSTSNRYWNNDENMMDLIEYYLKCLDLRSWMILIYEFSIRNLYMPSFNEIHFKFSIEWLKKVVMIFSKHWRNGILKNTVISPILSTSSIFQVLLKYSLDNFYRNIIRMIFTS